VKNRSVVNVQRHLSRLMNFNTLPKPTLQETSWTGASQCDAGKSSLKTRTRPTAGSQT